MKNVLFILLISSVAYSQQNLVEVNSLIANEYAFAAKALENGTKESFLQFIADDGILFRPTPVNGKKFLEESKTSSGCLIWYPTDAVVARTGDLGFTTGPWEYKKNKTDSTAIAFGNFCTVWRKQKDNSWKFMIDIGCNNDKPISKPTPLTYDTNKIMNLKKLMRGTKHVKPDELVQLDREFSILISKLGTVQTYKKFLNDKTKLLRDGSFPLIGTSSVLDLLAQEKKKYKYVPAGGGMSSLKDFGYTYGEMNSYKDGIPSVEKYNYLRIWQREEKHWTLLVEVNSKLNN